MFAPESRGAPGVFPFSTTATGTSPSFSVSSGSSSSSCISLIAQASPAGPPPTIATPTSMRSSSGSVMPVMNSSAGCTGGGNFSGAIDMAESPVPSLQSPELATGVWRLSASLLRLDRLGQLRDDLVEVADHAEVAELEDRGVLVLVDCQDVLRALHPDLVLDRAGDPERQVQVRRNRLAGLPDLGGVRVPAGVDHRAGGRDGAAHRLRELLGELEVLLLAEPAAAADEDLGVLDVDVGTALLPASHHRGLGRPLGELDLDVLDLGGATRLVRVEGVQAADDDPGLRDVADVGDLGVLKDRALGDELAVLDVHLGDLHGHARVQPRGQAGADLEAEQAAPEQRVAEVVVDHHLRHHVDDRLGEALRGLLAAVDPFHAVGAETRGRVIGHVADNHRGGLGAEFAGELRSLGEGAEGVLVELALVVMECVDQDARHQMISFRACVDPEEVI